MLTDNIKLFKFMKQIIYLVLLLTQEMVELQSIILCFDEFEQKTELYNKKFLIYLGSIVAAVINEELN